MCKKSQKQLDVYFAKSKTCRGAVSDFWEFLGGIDAISLRAWFNLLHLFGTIHPITVKKYNKRCWY